MGASRGSSLRAIGAIGALPVAKITKLSFVDVSPSIVAQLNETSAISRVIGVSTSAAIGASVAMNDSIVAMSGWIIPAPFAMPVIVTGTPSTATRREAPFGTVSVVMIADTAANQWSGANAVHATGNAASIFSTGSGSMMTPVENGSTWCDLQPSSDATAAQVVSAAAIPAAPVPAFALPALTTNARIALDRARWLRQTCTGAAQNRFRVNTPEAFVPASNTATSRSSRFQALIAAGAVPRATPGIASS